MLPCYYYLQYLLLPAWACQLFIFLFSKRQDKTRANNTTNSHVWKVTSIKTSACVWSKLNFVTEKDNLLYQVHKYCNHLKKMIKMAVILMDLLLKEKLLRFILLSNFIFSSVLSFADKPKLESLYVANPSKSQPS